MKVWCYFGSNGRVCADSDFKTSEEAWRVMLGWPTRGEVVEAKNRGDQVIAIDIRLPDSDALDAATIRDLVEALEHYRAVTREFMGDRAVIEADKIAREVIAKARAADGAPQPIDAEGQEGSHG